MPFPVKLDENLGTRRQELLRHSGFDVATVPEQNLEGAPDQKLILVCREENRCLITLDLDFSNPLQFPPHKFTGIVVLRCSPQGIYQQILEALKVFSRAAIQRETLTGKLWIVSPKQIREYLPVSEDS